MSCGTPCNCVEGKRRSPADRNWVVLHRKCNFSAFNGRRFTPSRYSRVKCLSCGCSWRTKAGYVDHLKDAELRPHPQLPGRSVIVGWNASPIPPGELGEERRCRVCGLSFPTKEAYREHQDSPSWEQEH